MKYLVVSDLHGSEYHCEMIKELFLYEKADKIVILGDLAHRAALSERARKALASLPVRPRVVEGNCDDGYADLPETEYEDRFYVVRDFSRQLFFTHGDYYNIANVPMILGRGDVLLYGHTHLGALTFKNGVMIANCGSLARPRTAPPSYVTVDESGIELKASETRETLEKLHF